MSTMSGLQELDARIDALNWVARTIDVPADVRLRIIAAADVFAEARRMVAGDYDAPAPEDEPEAAEETGDDAGAAEQAEAEAMPPAQAAAAELDDVPEKGVIVAPTAVIREWAQRQGIACTQGGRIGQKLLDEINELRVLKRLTPFQQRPGEAA